MSTAAGRAALPAVAAALVATVLGVQVAAGGGTFEPLAPADPCAARDVTSRSEGLDALTERLVLLGIDDAACSLGVTRETLTLDLARPRARSDAEVDALRAGLLAAVAQMEAAGTLPPASDLVDDALDAVELNRFVEAGLRALPGAVVDAALPTEDVLVRAVEDLDLRVVLDDLTDAGTLQAQVRDAVVRAVQDTLIARLRSLLP